MVALTLASPAQTRRFARVLARLLQSPALVTIEGDLGTGKTTLVREIMRARGVRGPVTSPSFTLAQSYRGRRPLDERHGIRAEIVVPGEEVHVDAAPQPIQVEVMQGLPLAAAVALRQGERRARDGAADAAGAHDLADQSRLPGAEVALDG